MRQYQYWIIGGGLAGDAAARGNRELAPISTIGMVSMEPDPPNARPSISKGLWKGRPIEKIWRNTRDRKFCKLPEEGQSLMRAAMSQLNLSAQAYLSSHPEAGPHDC